MFDNQFNQFAVTLLNSKEMVSHLPREHLRIAWYFHARGGSISVEVSGHYQHSKQLCDGMEMGDVHLLKKGNVKPVKSSFNEKDLIICIMYKLSLHKNGSFRSHQTRRSNGQCV